MLIAVSLRHAPLRRGLLGLQGDLFRTVLSRTFIGSPLHREPPKTSKPQTASKTAATPTPKAGPVGSKNTTPKESSKRPANAKPKTKTKSETKKKPKPKPKPKPRKVKKAKPKKKPTLLARLGGNPAFRLWTPPPKQGRISGWNVYLGSQLKGVPGLALAATGKTHHDAWMVLPESEKQIYEERAKQQSIVYHEQYDAWVATQSPEASKQYRAYEKLKHRLRIKAKHEKLGITNLKRPSSPFIHFYTEQRRQYGRDASGQTVPLTGHAKQVGKLWQEMTLGQKAPYIAIHEEQRKVYLQEKARLIEQKLKQTAETLTVSTSNP